MRVVLSVVALVVAVSALAMVSLSGSGEQQSQNSDEIARLKVRVSALERGATALRRGLDEVSAQLAEMRAAAVSRPRQPSRKPETSPSQPSATSPPSAAQPVPHESFREVVRKEIRRYYEDLRKSRTERRKKHQPEDWERKEFGDHARVIHRIGEKLGLSREQRRAYFQITKRFREQVAELWSRIKAEMGNASWHKKWERFRPERQRLVEQVRGEVESLLDLQQRAKYRELIEKDPYLRHNP